jgi:predicted nucleotidyltransferase component of viral defense system
MILEDVIEKWAQQANWQTPAMVEQDLIISRALVCLFNDDKIKERLVFRGGTALNKLFLNPPSRYSEDIDLVKRKTGPVGDTLDKIRQLLDPWLGTPKRMLTARSAKLFYRYTNIQGKPSRLKIEINVTERFQVLPLQEIPLSIASEWFQGDASILTYDLDELMATKLKALYQRKKGRDLFDLWLVLRDNMVDCEQVIDIFQKYCDKDNTPITGMLFNQNMAVKKLDKEFGMDIKALLPHGTNWNFDEAFDFVMEKLINRIP